MRRLLAGILMFCFLLMTAKAESVDFWGETWSFAVEDSLMRLYLDGEEAGYQPLAVSEGFAEAAKALTDAGQYAVSPHGVAAGLLPYLDPSLTGGGRAVACYQRRNHVFLAVDRAGMHVLRICHWNGSGYDAALEATVPWAFRLDSLHFGEDAVMLLIEYGEGRPDDVIFSLEEDGCWRLTSINNGEINPLGYGISFGGDWPRYGDHPWSDLKNINLAALPATREEALAALDPSGWAVVNTDGWGMLLGLYEGETSASVCLGAFYRGTPARVICVGDEMTQVDIGGLIGWMRTDCLVFGAAGYDVQPSCPSMEVTERAAYAVYTRPDRQSGVLCRERNITTVIGVMGEWYLVLDDNGQLGYVPPEALWAGNG